MTEDEAKLYIQNKVIEALTTMPNQIPNNREGRIMCIRVVQEEIARASHEGVLEFPWNNFRVRVPPIDPIDRASRMLRVDLYLPDEIKDLI
jgi:hypothetical protein